MQAFIRFNQGVLALPLPWRTWVFALIGLNIVTPFFFLGHVEAQAVLASGVLSMGVMTALTARFGFSRIVGLGHITWLPLVLFLANQLPGIPAGDAFGIWLRAVIVFDATSLALDAVDAMRFALGDRAETVATLTPLRGELRHDHR